jgi:iron complex transport system substrate-binding protein
MPIHLVARTMKVVALSAALFLSAPFPIQAQSTYLPVTVVDDSGVQTTFTAPPRRIVSLNPGHTETVFALGAGDRLVAVDTYSDYPVEARQVQPRLTTYPTVFIETVVSLKPDLVLALVEHDDVLNQLRERGVSVLKLFPKDFDTTTQEIATLGRVLGTAEPGKTIAATMWARRDAILQAVADAPRPTLF